jgi:hypothetical protein
MFTNIHPHDRNVKQANCNGTESAGMKWRGVLRLAEEIVHAINIKVQMRIFQSPLVWPDEPIWATNDTLKILSITISNSPRYPRFTRNFMHLASAKFVFFIGRY